MTPVVGGRNEVLNFGNVFADNKTTGDRNTGGGSGIGKNLSSGTVEGST